MKKLTLIGILILQFTFLFAQTQNISNIWGSSSKEESGYSIFEVNSNTYFVATQREYNSPIVYRECIVLKIDSNCNVTDSLKLMNYLKRGKYYSVSEFLKYNNRIIGWGFAIDTLTQKHNIWFSEFDENLTIIHDTLLGNGDSLINLYNANVLLTSQNKILMTLGFVPYIHEDTVSNMHDTTNVMVWLLDSGFSILKENTIFSHFGFDGFSVVEMHSNQSYHIITVYGIIQIKQSDLKVDSIVWQPYDVFLGGTGAIAINDSIYIHPTNHLFYTIPWHKSGFITCLFIRDKNGKTKDSVFIGDMQQSFDRTSIANIAFLTMDSIFVTGTNCSLDSAYFAYEDNTIFLWNIKLNGQVNWQKYYGIGKKFIVSNITETADGGCFLVGEVWDWHHYPDYTTDLFFLKVDRNGNITGSVGINEKINQSEIAVYPNPAKASINFNTGMYSNYHLSIFNALGQTIIQQHCTSSQNTFDIQSYPQGMYYYKLVSDKGKVISGKFVKE
ncbi:MAG: T9SS type A sorting domain-containing protein [Bacteroidota bacterium]